MSKEQFYNPQELRSPGMLTFDPIPMNQYNRTMEEEKKNYSKEQLVNIYRDMYIIRSFEEMLESIKMKGEYRGTKFTYFGAAHLSIGEEASAVVVHAAGEKDERGVEGEYRLGEDETRRGASIAGRGTGVPRR